MSEYTKQAEDFLQKHELEFRAVHIGNDCPTFCKDHDEMRDMDKLNTFPRKSHIHGHHYRITISRKGRGHFTVDFWNSYADEEQNYFCSGGRNWPSLAEDYRMLDKYKGQKKTTVQAYDVLAAITKSDPGTFEDFCGDYGYDTDSRKAEQVYFAVQKEWSKVRTFFTAEEIAELQEIN